MERLAEDLLELCVTQGGAEDLARASAVSAAWRILANDPRHTEQRLCLQNRVFNYERTHDTRRTRHPLVWRTHGRA